MNDFEKILNEYKREREKLAEANSNAIGVVLSKSEQKLDEYLSVLKNELKEQYCGNVPYNIPTLTDKELCETKLYKFCSAMPKGADLHVHDMALLPAKELLELLLQHPEFCINGDRVSFDLALENKDGTVPRGYVRLCDAVSNGIYNKEEIIAKWTVAGAEESEKNIWAYFEDLFCRQGVLSDNPSFALSYYDCAFRYYCRKNIMHIEIHLMLTESLEQSEEYVKAVREAYYRVKKDYPYFTLRIIGAGVKADNDNIELTKRCFLNASYVQETIKDESNPDSISDLIIGFDLVNEEDTSLPLRKFVPMLLKAKRQYPSMKFFIHGGESLDAENDNLIDAYLLGVSRVGHGLNLYRFPDLHTKFVKSEICLEMCPVSNKSLGYTKDIRNHPATEYLKTGVTVVLCSDDPSYMENETLTDDFFAAVVCWNLNVADLKLLAINSLRYSGLDKETKLESLKTFEKMWNQFVSDQLEKSDAELWANIG